MPNIFQKPPTWWYGQNVAQRLVAGGLHPVSALYSMGAKWDYKRRDSYVSKLPVLCIGNFTAGGAGKTPLAVTIIHMLQEMGEKPVILTRGYGGKVSGPYQVDLENDDAGKVGDEPLMLAFHTAVVISANRAVGAQAIEQGEGTVILMDDGFQNNSLTKDLSLVVVDGKTGIGNGQVMPSGPLRGAMDFQLPLADALIINGAGVGGKTVTETAQKRDIAVFQASLKMAEEKAAWLKGKKVIAFTGIGRPSKFYETLKANGADILDTVDFPDHHQFTHNEAAHLLEKASQTEETYLVTTQKDAMRLKGGKGALQWLGYEVEVIPVNLLVEQADDLRQLIGQTLKTKRATTKQASATEAKVENPDN